MCEHLDIPHYVVDLSAEFGAAVVDDFVEAYLAGETPNPCVKCNQHIKFTPLLARARAIGADTLVTGHYAQILNDADTWALHRGRDAQKDQSYFLFSMPGDELAAVRFPLGGMTKDEVRAHALRLGLPNATKDESQEICFVPDGDYAGFVAASALKRGRAAADGRRDRRHRRHRARPPRRHPQLHGRPAPRPRQPRRATRRRRARPGSPTSATSPASTPRRARSASARAKPPSAARSRSATCAGSSPPRDDVRRRRPGPPPRHADRGRRHDRPAPAQLELVGAHRRRERPGRRALRR